MPYFVESPDYSEGVSHDSAGAVSPEFLKKLEEWEKVKALKGMVHEPVHEKTNNLGSDQVRHKQGCIIIEAG